MGPLVDEVTGRLNPLRMLVIDGLALGSRERLRLAALGDLALYLVVLILRVDQAVVWFVGVLVQLGCVCGFGRGHGNLLHFVGGADVSPQPTVPGPHYRTSTPELRSDVQFWSRQFTSIRAFAMWLLSLLIPRRDGDRTHS